MHEDLGKSMKVKFENIFLDPNNPRIAPEDSPGYEELKAIFSPNEQKRLSDRVWEVYSGETLEHAILIQGWVPIDSILVWEHHRKKDHFIVVEGNTRTAALRRIRERLPKEVDKLSRMQSKAKQYSPKDIADQKLLVDQIKQIIADTEKLDVFPVVAKTPTELAEKLPRLLGVRHITSAKQWTPYATNLYMLSLYMSLFAKHYPDDDLTLKPELVEAVGKMVSVGTTATRRNLQAASAFSHMRAEFEDKLSTGDAFSDADHYYFENILANKYAQEQFGFGKDDLHLSPEMEEVLFQWAFRYPRNDADESKNVLRKAEDIRLWAKMKRYDDANGTAFSNGLDVEKPKDATPMTALEAEFLARKAQVSPLNTIRSLLESFKSIQAETLMSQASHLRPMLEELCTLGDSYMQMMDAVSDGEGTEHAAKRPEKKRTRGK